MTTRRPPRLLDRLGAIQAARPFAVLLVALATLVPAGLFAARLGFRPDFAELLPDNKPSVIEMRRVSERLPGITSLTVTAEIADGKNEAALRAFVDALVARLERLGPPAVEQIDWGVHATRRFFDHNALLFAALDKLKQTRDEVVARYEYEVQKQAGMLLEEDDADAPAPITADSLRARLLGEEPHDASGKSSGGKPATGGKPAGGGKGAETKTIHDNGYYMSPDGRFAAVVVRTSVSGKAERAALRRAVESEIAAVGPRSFDPTMEIGFTGDLVLGGEEYDAIVRDLGEVGLFGVLGVLASVLVFFRRVRTVLVMGASLLVGLGWTFGLTYFAIGYLNSSTGFLVSIIAGNGINYGIMYMARYMEARRAEGADVATAIAIAHRDTWLPTIAASATAMLAYGSLVVTDFRGFKHFGIIGGYGMVLCWVATYLFTPALLAASERVWPAYRPDTDGDKPRQGALYALLFSRLAHAAPRAVTLVGAAVSVAALVLAYRYVATDPMEYDMDNIRSERRDKSEALTLSRRVGKIVGRMSQDGMAVMTDRLDQVLPFVAAMEQRYAAAPANRKPFEKVVSIYSLLPTAQSEKIPLVEELLTVLRKARAHKFVSDTDWKELGRYLPESDLGPIGIDDLPEPVARPFTERDGTRGRIVYIVPKTGESVWNARYLIRWADSFRSTTLPTGEVIKGSGRAVIYADMIQSVVEDAPKAIVVAALGAILVILVAFRGRILAIGVFLPWLAGLAMLLGFLQLRHIKLNFLNFIALPITCGIGAEYAHNLMQRYRSERGAHLDRVITETGGAVVLCSLTTAIGYLALVRSINRGIASFGLAAAVGEIVCVLCAVLILPAALVWWQQRRSGKAPA